VKPLLLVVCRPAEFHVVRFFGSQDGALKVLALLSHYGRQPRFFCRPSGLLVVLDFLSQGCSRRMLIVIVSAHSAPRRSSKIGG